jgi:hypothetical protein
MRRAALVVVTLRAGCQSLAAPPEPQEPRGPAEVRSGAEVLADECDADKKWAGPDSNEKPSDARGRSWRRRTFPWHVEIGM